MIEKASNMIARGRSRLCTFQPFFGVLALHLKPTESSGLGTMATDGDRLLYDPEWVVDNLSSEECETIISHEALHAAFIHPLRQKNTKFPLSIYRQATEHAVNNILAECGYSQPSCGWIMDDKYRNWSVEEICRDLQDNQSDDENDQGDRCSGEQGDDVGIGGHSCLDESASEGKTEEEMQTIADGMKIRLSKAAAAAKTAGNMPAGIQRLIEEELYPSVNWSSYIRQFLETVTDDDYSWLRPSEEYLQYDIYIPSMQDEGIKKPIVFAVDTSASMSDKLNQIFGEISSIMQDFKPQDIHIVYADADVAGHDEFSYEDLPITTKAMPKGGGGTSFNNTFKWINDKNIDPLCVIYLTDMICWSFPDKEPDYGVLWGSTTPLDQIPNTPPFGELVHIDV